MADREKVIKGLKIERECVNRNCDRECAKCDLVQDREWLLSVYDDALELLKEQEPVKPILVKLYPHDVYRCGNCGHCAVGTTVSNTYRPKYCPECGRKVKWDESVD